MLFSPIGMFHDELSWPAQDAMISVESCAKGTPTVTRRGLNVNFLKRRFSKDFTVGDAVQSYPAGHAQFLKTCLFVSLSSHLQEHFFGDRLDTRSNISVILIALPQFFVVCRPLAEVRRITTTRREKVCSRVSRLTKKCHELSVESVF